MKNVLLFFYIFISLVLFHRLATPTNRPKLSEGGLKAPPQSSDLLAFRRKFDSPPNYLPFGLGSSASQHLIAHRVHDRAHGTACRRIRPRIPKPVLSPQSQMGVQRKSSGMAQEQSSQPMFAGSRVTTTLIMLWSVRPHSSTLQSYVAHAGAASLASVPSISLRA